MISRREMLQWGMVAPALASVSQIAFAGELPALGTGLLDAILLDDRLSPAAGWSALPAGVTTLHFAGDVTQIWYETIDPAWRHRGYVLGGITAASTLFVLETLAHQQGRRVVSHVPLNATPRKPDHSVRWIIAPHHRSVMP